MLHVGMGWMAGMDIIGHRSSKSTFGANNLDCGHGDDGQTECGWADFAVTTPSSSQQVTTMIMTSVLSTISSGVLFCKSKLTNLYPIKTPAFFLFHD